MSVIQLIDNIVSDSMIDVISHLSIDIAIKGPILYKVFPDIVFVIVIVLTGMFVCNRGYTIQYHGGFRSRELGQACYNLTRIKRWSDCIGYRIEIACLIGTLVLSWLVIFDILSITACSAPPWNCSMPRDTQWGNRLGSERPHCNENLLSDLHKLWNISNALAF